MKKKEDKKRRRFLLLPLFFSFILFVTTSYAWFSSNRVVSVDSLDVHVQADGGLEVSTDAVNWKQVVTVQDIMNARQNYGSSVNQVPASLYPVSTGGTIDGNGRLELFRGDATNFDSTDFVLVTQKSEEIEGFGEDSEGIFIAFDLFFRTTNNKELYLSNNSEVTYLGEESVGIENATRVAFLDEGTATDSSGAAQSLRGATDAIIWEPNYDTHTEFGVLNARNVYGITTSQTGGALLPYDGVTSEIGSGDGVLIQNANSTNYPNYFRRIDVDISTPRNNGTNQKILDLEPSITKIRIYMWLEGQDVDCEDNASYGDISFRLEFTTNPA